MALMSSEERDHYMHELFPKQRDNATSVMLMTMDKSARASFIDSVPQENRQGIVVSLLSTMQEQVG